MIPISGIEIGIMQDIRNNHFISFMSNNPNPSKIVETYRLLLVKYQILLISDQSELVKKTIVIHETNK